jgi:inositol-phosphate phosphatase/L-galactose 1-phosphate phosphatase
VIDDGVLTTPPPLSLLPPPPFSGDIIAAAFAAPKAVSTKAGDRDLVTATDAAAERAILAALRAAFPAHAFVGEEEAAAAGRTPPMPRGTPTWCVDPLDGTTNFVHGQPFVAVSIGLLDAAGVPALGVVLNPVLEELFVGVVGRGASLNGRPMRTSGEAALPRALLGTEIGVSTDPAVLDAMYGRLRAYAAAGRSLRCGGSCALGLCSVAAGRLDAFFEIGFGGPWDVVAGAAILTEAGGTVCDPAGGRFDPAARRVLGAASGALADAAAGVLAGAPLAGAEPQPPVGREEGSVEMPPP